MRCITPSFFAPLFLAVSTALPGLGVSLAAGGERPVVEESTGSKKTASNDTLPTLFVVGDSTLKSNNPMRGWGQEIGAFFDATKIHVVNRAIGGRSSKTFQTEGRWEKVLDELKPGDFLLVQFGHNDVGRYDDPNSKWRPSIHGEGDESVEFTRPDGTRETIHSFGWYMRKYGADAKAKGATVIFCSMVPHKDWKNGKIVRKEQETFVQWTANAAKATGAAFIDLNESVALRYEGMGPEKVEPLFADRRTHTSPAGAKLNAECVVAGLRGLPGAPLDSFLSDAGRAIRPTPEFVTAAPSGI